MKNLLTLLGLVKNRILTIIMLLGVIFVATASAQSSQSTVLNKSSNVANPSDYGLSADKKSYMTKGGKTIVIGQSLTLGSPADKINNIFINCSPTILHQTIPNKYLLGKYTSDTIVIKELWKDNDDVVYLFFKKGIYNYRIAIEAAIDAKELIVN